MPIYRVKKSVEQALTGPVLANLAEPGLEGYEERIDLDDDVDLDLVRRLVDHALELYDSADDHNDLDAWLAPRLHAAVRVSRRAASDAGFWTWLALRAGRAYVTFRWKRDDGQVSAWRYTGDLTRNALARLWWFAEMARNGPNYEHAEAVFRRVSTAQWAMELAYSRYRPAVIAFVRLAEGLDGEKQLTAEQMHMLSKKLNAYLTLQPLEAVGLHDSVDLQYDDAWRADMVTLSDLTVENLSELRGPQDGTANEQTVTALLNWFRSLLEPTTSRAA